MCQTVPTLRFACSFATLLAFGATACAGDGRERGEDGGRTHDHKAFDSADPASSLPGVNESDESEGEDPESEFTGPTPNSPSLVLSAGWQQRAQRDGNVLAVLGEDGALSVVDVDRTALLSRYYKGWGETPLRLELQGHVAIALLQDPSRRVNDNPVTSGTLLALDIAKPERPRVVADLTIEGSITRIERSGDVLLVLADHGAESALTSFDISAPTAIEQVSQLSFPDSKTEDMWWKPQLALSGSRAYVYTPDAAHDAALTFIDVVEVSNAGVMHAGKHLTVGGAVLSAGYVSESDGVLRVLGSTVPSVTPSEHVVVQTFNISSADAIEPIASLDLPLSQDMLGGPIIHFADAVINGDRAYVMTKVAEAGEYFGELTLIDLSNPEAPSMAGAVDVGLPIAFLPLKDRALVASNPYDTTQIRLDLIDAIAADRHGSRCRSVPPGRGRSR